MLKLSKFLFLIFCLLNFFIKNNAIAAENKNNLLLHKIFELEKKINQLENKNNDLTDLVHENSLRLDKANSGIQNNFVKTGLSNANLGGFLQVEARSYDNKFTNNIRDSGASVRRARLTLNGAVDNFGYRFQYDFAPNLITDAFITYNGFQDSEIKIGNFKPPFSLEKIISVAQVTFIERSNVAQLTPARLVGAQFSKFGKDWSGAIAVFGDDLGSSVRTQTRNEGSSYSASGRFVYSPINNEKNLLHLGLSTSYFSKNRKTTVVNNISSYEPIDSEGYLDFEMAARLSSIYLQSEYIINKVNFQNDAVLNNRALETNSLKSVFYGYYVQASWFLTGDKKEYNARVRDFGAVQVKNAFDKGGVGAWELAARYASLDRNSNDGARNITLGKTDDITLAINWYPNNNLRVMANYQHSKTDTRIGYLQKQNAFLLRTQIAF